MINEQIVFTAKDFPIKVSGTPDNKEHNALAWITPEEVEEYEFCPADRKMIMEAKVGVVLS